MDIEALRACCLEKKGVSESFPFDDEVLVFKVLDKIFAAVNINKKPWAVNLKCDPEKAIAYREKHPEITPGFHMNKKHWNTVQFGGALPDALIKHLVNHSYELVVSKMTKRNRELLKAM